MIRHDVPASELTTLAVGGPIATVIDVTSENELLAALSEHPEAICIGGGSNLLVADTGLNGVVVRSYGSDNRIHSLGDGLVRVDAPADWDSSVNAMIDLGLQGLEATSGVPGSFGGAIVQNLGAYGQEVGDVVEAVNVWNTATRTPERLTKDNCSFSYRNSRFKHDLSRKYIVTSAELRLRSSHEATPRYGEVSELLKRNTNHDGPYPLLAIRESVLEVRRSKGMLIGTSLPSAGSFFTNPIVNSKQAANLNELGFKTFTRTDGNTLVSAAALIQAAGYHRGFCLGRAGLSTQHVLALVNTGDATATDIIDLARRLRDDVHKKFDVVLTPEPVAIGFTSDPFD